MPEDMEALRGFSNPNGRGRGAAAMALKSQQGHREPPSPVVNDFRPRIQAVVEQVPD